MRFRAISLMLICCFLVSLGAFSLAAEESSVPLESGEGEYIFYIYSAEELVQLVNKGIYNKKKVDLQPRSVISLYWEEQQTLTETLTPSVDMTIGGLGGVICSLVAPEGKRHIELKDTSLILINMLIIGDVEAVNTFTGGISHSGAGEIHSYSCQYANNHSRGNGGAIEAEGLVYANQSVFVLNKAEAEDVDAHGGAVYTEGLFYYDRCSFYGNRANGNGGAVAAALGMGCNTTFTHNLSNQAGGAIFAEKTMMSISNTIVFNLAMEEGGGIASEAVHLTNTILVGNSSTNSAYNDSLSPVKGAFNLLQGEKGVAYAEIDDMVSGETSLTAFDLFMPGEDEGTSLMEMGFGGPAYPLRFFEENPAIFRTDIGLLQLIQLGLPEYTSVFPLLESVDLLVDQKGNVRNRVTCIGAHDQPQRIDDEGELLHGSGAVIEDGVVRDVLNEERLNYLKMESPDHQLWMAYVGVSDSAYRYEIVLPPAIRDIQPLASFHLQTETGTAIMTPHAWPLAEEGYELTLQFHESEAGRHISAEFLADGRTYIAKAQEQALQFIMLYLPVADEEDVEYHVARLEKGKWQEIPSEYNPLNATIYFASPSSGEFFIYHSSIQTSVIRFHIDQNAYTYDDKSYSIDVAPQLLHDRSYLPLRYAAEALGFDDIVWDGSEAIFTKGETEIRVQNGSTELMLNGSVIVMDAPVESIDGRMMIPVRWLSEAVGAEVKWDGTAQSVTILQEHLISVPFPD